MLKFWKLTMKFILTQTNTKLIKTIKDINEIKDAYELELAQILNLRECRIFKKTRSLAFYCTYGYH